MRTYHILLFSDSTVTFQNVLFTLYRTSGLICITSKYILQHTTYNSVNNCYFHQRYYAFCDMWCKMAPAVLYREKINQTQPFISYDISTASITFIPQSCL